MYKYMTWTEAKYFEGNQLLKRNQVAALLRCFSDRKLEQFVTIQDYDKDGDIIGCPLYFDIDASSLYDAYEEMQDLVDGIREEYNVEPRVSFSGGKGFHVIAPLYIRHNRCHEIVKLIWQEKFKSVECDPKVYRTRAMFRVENTWNIKGNKYKIPVYPNDELHTMINRADSMCMRVDKSWDAKDLDVSEYIDRLPTYKEREASGDITFTDMMPCLKNLWSMPVPPEGSRHELAHLFIRHCFSSGLDRYETESQFDAHPFWKDVNSRDYTKIISSVYGNSIAMIGCKNNEMLQGNCVKLCKYNSKLNLWDIPMTREKQ